MISGARQDRLWIAGGIVVAVLLAAASWFLFIGPKLDDADSVRAQTQAAADQNTALQLKVDKLRQDSAGLPDLMHSLDTLHTELPTTSSLDEFTRQITAQATSAGVTVTSIVIGVPAVVKSARAAGSAAAPSTADSSGSVDGTAGTDDTGSGAADATTSSAPAPAPAAAAGAGLYSIPVTIAADGPLQHQQKLLHAIQTQGPRGALVSSVQFAPASGATGSSDQASDQASGQGLGQGLDQGLDGGERSTDNGAAGTVQPTTSTGTPSGAGGPAPSTSTAAAPGSTSPVPAGPDGALTMPVTMTVQLTVFVAPQTPDDAAALRKQLGG